MPSISEGLEVEGESGASDVNTDRGFEEHLARQVGKSIEPATTEAEPESASNPSRDTPDEIRRAVLDDKLSPTLAAGLTVAGEKKPPESEFALQVGDRTYDLPIPAEARSDFDRALRQQESEESTRQAEGRELAYRRALDVIEDPDLLDPDYLTEEELVALMRLRDESPEMFAAVLENLDEQAFDAWDPRVDPDLDELYPDGFPGMKIGHLVDHANTHMRAIQAEDLATRLEQSIAADKAEVIAAAYEARGVPLEQMPLIWQLDSAFFYDMGYDPNEMKPEEIKTGLELLDAAAKELASEQRQVAFRNELLNADTTDVQSGLTVLGPYGYMPVQPPASPYRNFNPEEFESRVLARMNAATRPMTKGDLRRAIVQPEPTTLQYTTADGREISVDEATGERERFERQRREERARAMSNLRR